MDKSDNLVVAVKKRITTVMIGCLDSIEKKFGEIWNSGVPYDELTEEEQLAYTLWTELRKEILDKGNREIKLVEQDIKRYNITEKRYSLHLPVKKIIDKKEQE